MGRVSLPSQGDDAAVGAGAEALGDGEVEAVGDGVDDVVDAQHAATVAVSCVGRA
jgi:hypothetical protein